MKKSNPDAKSIIYTGPSMNPTLKNLDILTVVPYNNNEVKVGDVITFTAPYCDRSITHRAISVDSRGVRTFGDNNNRIDIGFRQPEDIIGKVEYAKRKKRYFKVHGGKIGHLYGIIIRSIRYAKEIFWRKLFVIQPVYYSLSKKSMPLMKYAPPKLRPRVFSFTRGDFIEQQLVIGKRVVGRRSPGSQKWQIKPPFRFFIDEEILNTKPPQKPPKDDSC